VFFNWVFIFGHLGAPRLEVQGAAIGTLIARAVELTIMLVFMKRFEHKIRFKLRYLLHLDKVLLQDFVRVGTPVIATRRSGRWVPPRFRSSLGIWEPIIVAANSIAMVLNQFVSVFIYGVGNAGSVIIGNTVGTGDYALVQKRAIRLLGISVLGGRHRLHCDKPPQGAGAEHLPHFRRDRQITLQVITVYAFVSDFQSVAMTTLVGILRGGGDVKFVLFIDIIFLWLVALPGGAFAGLYLKLPAAAVFVILKFDELLKDIFSVARILRGRWIKDLTR
jgi:Na+-driven multidrug efflux pump